jgi:ankyrin repeat protein
MNETYTSGAAASAAVSNKKMTDEIELFCGAALTGNEEKVCEFIRKHASDKEKINTHTESGATALYVASQSGHLRIVELLVENGADLDVVEKCAGCSPLITAIAYEKTQVARFLVERGAAVNLKQADGDTALMAAATKNNAEVVSLLVQYNVDINAPGKSNQTPLSIACAKKFTSIVALLLKSGANPNQRGRYGITPLFSAASSGNTDIIKLLLDKNADVNCIDDAGYTAITYAANSDVANFITSYVTAKKNESMSAVSSI